MIARMAARDLRSTTGANNNNNRGQQQADPGQHRPRRHLAPGAEGAVAEGDQHDRGGAGSGPGDISPARGQGQDERAGCQHADDNPTNRT